MSVEWIAHSHTYIHRGPHIEKWADKNAPRDFDDWNKRAKEEIKVKRQKKTKKKQIINDVVSIIHYFNNV